MTPPSTTSTAKLILGLLLAFIGLGLADLFLTWRLIQTNDGHVFESNPVANWCLVAYGWGGMAAFKLGMLVLIGGLVAVIAFSRPRTAELILVFACGAQSAVVVYS